eukprot:CAMPEP_0180523030 /NCGR_PEP_ID=MMETSP1036_2-20121128/57767_1 /TAXON_ID=632150 /ORGANISM="Azadinium spinosum, Strain 3D9" /LENGTH=34 /DNA_ID= /DNA_START= /DNA_END= /DNA_ORIENTATION=
MKLPAPHTPDGSCRTRGAGDQPPSALLQRLGASP